MAEPPSTIVLCSEYERLLEECEQARTIWRKRRVEVCSARLIGKEAGDELLRLQAKYARAWAVCKRHLDVCPLCLPLSKIA